MGFNCVQSYVFWNASEPKEGQWDFTDNVDLDAWLSLLQEMHMYALVRVGPYSCAEWEEGGYPAWLTVKPGMTQRELGPSTAYSDPHLDRVEAITAKHQVSHGGNVILVQLENEHSRGWGTQVDDPYLNHLDDQARKNGIDVATFNSGLHHSQEPSGEVPFPPDPSPWYSTEFWTGWIAQYGEMTPGTIAVKTHGTWKIIAFGGAGYNYYMAHGGTNFGYSGDSHAASYDYSAPIGEAGQLRSFYFFARRAAQFARSFNDLLTGSHNDPDFAKCDRPELRVTTRTNPTGGSIIFVDHFPRTTDAAGVHHAAKADPDPPLDAHLTVGDIVLPHQGSLKVAAVEPRTVLVNVPWTDNAHFESVCTNVLFRQTIGGTDYWVCYGPAGETGEATVRRKKPIYAPQQYDFTYPAGDKVQEISIDSGDGHTAKLLVMNTDMSSRTWLAQDKLYVGPSFVLEDGSLEFPPGGGTAAVYTASGVKQVSQAAVAEPTLPALASWTWRDAAPERAPDLKTDDKWIQSSGPLAMESYDGFANRYGWYRTVLHRDAAGPVSLHLGGQSGTFQAYLNGKPAAPATFQYSQSATLKLPDAKAGDNALAILVKASPRSKDVTPPGMIHARGIWGGVSTDEAATPLTVSWKKWDHPPRDAVADDVAKPDFDDSKWSAVDEQTLANPIELPRNNSWYRGTLTLSAGQVDSVIELPNFMLHKKDALVRHPTPVHALFYVNGHPMTERIEDASKWLKAGNNTLLYELQSRLGGESAKLELLLWHNSPLTKATWSFHGGLDDLDETAVVGRVTNWNDFLTHAAWQNGNPNDPNEPTFWKCSFNYHQPEGTRQTIGLVTDGLKSGNVWLNGHNLGECPQTVLMYMPECWLKDGANDLVVFDMSGAKPDQVKLATYETFSSLH